MIKQSSYVFVIGNNKPKQQNKKQKTSLIVYHNIFQSTCSETHLLLLRDFNGKIGSEKHGIINGEPKVSRNGALLRNVKIHFNLEILNNKANEEK